VEDDGGFQGDAVRVGASEALQLPDGQHVGDLLFRQLDLLEGSLALVLFEVLTYLQLFE